MSELTLNLSDYKSSGVYFVEIDNSIITGSVNSASYRGFPLAMGGQKLFGKLYGTP